MTFNFSTTKGIRAVADHLDTLAAEAPGKGEISIGHLRLVNSTAALTRAAALLRSNSRSGWAYPPRRPSRQDLPRNIRVRYHDPKSPIFSLDAVYLCGSPEAALETIRRHLDPRALPERVTVDTSRFLNVVTINLTGLPRFE